MMDIEMNGLMIPTWPIGAILLVTLVLITRRHLRQTWSYCLCLLIFGVYLLFALDKTFFPLQLNGNYVDVMRQTTDWMRFVNLIPFYPGLGGYNEYILTSFAQNILLTIPFGFGISFITPLRRKNFIWLPFAVGFGIETAQLLISLLLRFPYRVIDINDALFNAMGVGIGYGLFRLFARLFLALSQRLNFKIGSLFAYIHQVSSRA